VSSKLKSDWPDSNMAHITRTATVQARVTPVIKQTSERILWRLGLSMSEAMELFLRRVILDERIPFEIVALNTEYASGSLSEASTCGLAERQHSGSIASKHLKEKTVRDHFSIMASSKSQSATSNAPKSIFQHTQHPSSNKL